VAPLPNGEAGVPYAFHLIASGGVRPYAWSVSSGPLPKGLTLNPSGVISGTPKAWGTFPLTLQVADSATPPGTATIALTLTITDPIAIVTPPPPAGEAGVPYYFDLNASGGVGPYAWSISSGSLPSGLKLKPATGVISGTPSASGTFPLTVQVTDSALLPGTANVTLTLVIKP
jgi:hypothetical protein